MTKVYQPTRGARTVGVIPFVFSSREDAQNWVDRQIAGGDDGDLGVAELTVFDTLEEYDECRKWS